MAARKPRRSGPKPRPTDQLRTHVIRVPVTTDEHALIRSLAGDQPLAPYMRDAMLARANEGLTDAVREELVSMYLEVEGGDEGMREEAEDWADSIVARVRGA